MRSINLFVGIGDLSLTNSVDLFGRGRQSVQVEIGAAGEGARDRLRGAR